MKRALFVLVVATGISGFMVGCASHKAKSKGKASPDAPIAAAPQARDGSDVQLLSLDSPAPKTLTTANVQVAPVPVTVTNVHVTQVPMTVTNIQATVVDVPVVVTNIHEEVVMQTVERVVTNYVDVVTNVPDTSRTWKINPYR